MSGLVLILTETGCVPKALPRLPHTTSLVLFAFFWVLELHCSDCSVLTPPFSESGNSRREEVKGPQIYVGIGVSGYGEGWSVPLPQYPVATSGHHAEIETGVVKYWFQMLPLVGDGLGRSDPICAHNPDCWHHNQETECNFTMGVSFT